MSRFLCSASVLCLLPVASLAQELIIIPENTAYANQTQVPLSRSGATVEIVEKEDIQAAPQTRLADYLGTLPGVTVSSNGGLGSVTNVRMRGLSQAYVPVLIDGIDVTDPSSPQTSFDWANLTTANIARVEIVKGAQSAVHGSEAIGGIIAITTARPEGEGTFVDMGVEYGSYNTFRGNLAVTTRGDRGELSFGISRVETEGFSAREGDIAFTTDEFDEADGYEATQLTLSGAYDVTDTVRLGFSAFRSDSSADFDSGPYSAVPEDGTTETTANAARVFAEVETGAIDHTFSISKYTIDRTVIDNGESDPFQGSRSRVDYKGVWNVNSGLTVSFGADSTKETFKSTELDYATWPPTRRSTSEETRVNGVFVEALYAPTEQLDLSLSLRQDDHSEFGGFTSARAALAYRLRDDLTIRAVASNGFRAPSLYELHSQLYGNPDLDPEKARSFELGIEKTFVNGSYIQATAFYTETDDLIAFVGSGYDQTDGTTKAEGIEISGAAVLTDRISVNGAFTYTDSRDRNDDPTLRIPRYDLNLGVAAQLTDRLSGGLNVQHIADRPDEFGTEMDDYTLVNMTLDYAITDTTNAYLRIENLGDADYQTAGGYATSDRAAFFGIRASF